MWWKPPTWQDDGRERERSVSPEPSTSNSIPARGRKKDKKRGMYVTRALKSKLKERLERERLVSLSESSGSDEVCPANDEFENLDSSLLNEVISMVEREERGHFVTSPTSSES